MQLTNDIYSLLPLTALLIALILAYNSWKYSNSRIGITFVVLIFALAWWSLAAFLERSCLDLTVKIFWIKMTYFGIAVLPVAWLTFVLQYSDREKWLNRNTLRMLAVIPVITLVMVWTNDIHHLMWKDIWLDTSISPPVDAVTHGAWFWVQAAYAYLLLLSGTLCLMGLFRKSSGIYRKQAWLLLVAALIPWLGNLLFIAGIRPFSVSDPTPLAFAITGIAFFWGLSRLQLLNIMPIAYEAVFRSMIDGVIVVDNYQLIVEINPAAESIIGNNRSEVIGRPLSKVLPFQTGLFDLKFETTEKRAEIELGQGLSKRSYGIYISSVKIRQNLNGNVILLHDETERKKAEFEDRKRAILETEIIERKLAQEKLTKSEEKYSTIVEKGNDGILIIQNGIIQFANIKNTEISGFSHDEIIGRSLLDFISPDYRESVIETLKRKMSGEPVPNKYEVDILTKGGSTKSVEINTNGINYEGSPADIAIIRDITERKKAQEALKESEERFKQVTESAGEMIWEVDTDGLFSYCSPVVQKMLGYSSDELIGKKHFYDLFAPDCRDELRKAAMAAFESKQPFQGFINPNVHKNGSLVILETSGVPILDKNGRLQGYRGADTDITERKRVEEKVLHLASFPELNPCPILEMDRESNLKYLNPASKAVFSELATLGVNHPFLKDWVQVVKQLQNNNWTENVTREVIVDHSIYQQIITPVAEDLIRIYGTDITDRKLVEEEIQTILRTTIDGFYLVDTEGRIIDTNDSYCSMIGYSREELLKMEVKDVVAENEEAIIKRIRRIREIGYERFETTHMHKDGRIINIEASINFLAMEKPKLFCFMRDITDRKKAEENLAELNEELRAFNQQLETKVEERTLQLEEAVVEAQASNLAKSEFLASMSHELRTPLNAVIGFSQVLDAQYFGKLNEKQSEYIKDVLDSGRHLLSLINDILDLSRIEAGKMELEISEVKVADVLRHSLVMIKEKAQTHNIKIDVRIACEIENLIISADERRLKQVMFNLLSNASKFTPDDGNIRVEAKMESGELVISVSDTGIGISAKEQTQLFKAFYQASGGIKDKTPGTGLGLKITKSIVEKHGGRIWMDSEGSGKGSCFSFTLPIRVETLVKK